MKKERIAIISGLRTPLARAGGKFKNMQADTLGARLIRELMMRAPLQFDDIDEVIIGNVSQPIHAANIARVISLRAGFPEATPAMTVNRNCASGIESLTSATAKILAKEGKIYLCGGVESMSNIPLLYNKNMTNLFTQLSKARTALSKIKTLFSFRPTFLKPIIGLISGLTDPVTGLLMGSTTEILVKDFAISREEQDQYALQSHQKAQKAKESSRFTQEIFPIIYDEKRGKYLDYDDGIRADLNLEKLTKLRPFFDKKNGTVTAGNSSQVTDAAAAIIVMSEDEAKRRGLTPLGYLSEYIYKGLDPKRMGLGPVFATHGLFKKRKISMKDIDLIEMNEAFSGQVLACLKAFSSKAFAKAHFGENEAVGSIDTSILNVNGGSIALGHPVGMTGTRLIITMLHELRNRSLKRGLVTLCIGGGQGVALLLEAE